MLSSQALYGSTDRLRVAYFMDFDVGATIMDSIIP
jgi:hypothetical protein